MFRKLVSNLPFSPSLINQLSFYSRRLKKEQYTRKIGLIFTVLALIVQTLTIVAPAKATLAANGNDIIFGGGDKQEISRVYQSGCDTQGRCDIRAIYDSYGINDQNLANAEEVSIYSSEANNYWSIGRAPRGYGGEVGIQIPGGPYIYSRTLNGWQADANWDALKVETSQGTRWILRDCGNIVTQPGQPEAPKHPDIKVDKMVDNPAPLLGQQFTYTIKVSNIGDGVASNVNLYDGAPDGIDFIASSEPSALLNNKTFQIGNRLTVAPGQTLTYTITAKVTKDGPIGPLNKACSDYFDVNIYNNCGTALVLVRPVCQLPGKQNLPADDKSCNSPNIKIEKTVDKAKLLVGDAFTYTVTVKNIGDTNLDRVVMRDAAPDGVELVAVKQPGETKFTAVTNKQDFTSKVFSLAKNETKEFKIQAKAIKPAQRLENVACAFSATPNQTAGGCTKVPVTVTDVCPSNPKLPKNDAGCQLCQVPGKQNLPADSPACKPCDEQKQSTDGKDISCLEMHKKARNITQQLQNANGTTAKAGDSIEYTLSVTNRSKEVRKGFVVEENMQDVLEYADLIDGSGATFTEKPVKMLAWAPVDIKPNETVNRTILIKIKSPIPNTPASTSDPLSYDMKLVNVYGDTVQIDLPSNPIKVTEQTVKVLPSTGLGANIIISTVLISTAAYFYFRSRVMVKELSLVRQQFNYGAGV